MTQQGHIEDGGFGEDGTSPPTLFAAPPLTIAFFMQDFAGGGVEKMRLRLAAPLAARGHRVSLIVVSAQGPLAGQVPPGVTVHDLASRRVLHAVPKLRRHLLAHRPDVLVSSLDHNNIAALVATAGRRIATRIVICQHNALAGERALGWKYRAVPLLYRLLQHRAAAIIAVSQGVATDLVTQARLPPGAIRIIENPVFDPADLPPPDAAPPHPWLADPAVPVYLFAGRLVPQKDPMMLMAAFAARRIAGPARLIILGDGPLRPAMQHFAREHGIAANVDFAGYVPDPLAWIAHASALILTSRYEGFGNVIVEALACGTPVIATDCPHGPAEILDHGRFGRLVPCGDATACAAALQEDLRAVFPRDMLRARARAYTVANAADKHEALFRSWPPWPVPRAFGLSFAPLDAAALARHIVTQPCTGAARLIVTPNLDHIRHLRQPAFAAACAGAAMVCADGWPVALYARLRRAAPGRRTTGCDLLRALMALEAFPRQRVFAVVESAPTANALRRWCTARGVAATWSIAVAPAGLAQDPTGQADLATAITKAAPDILLMTLGAPVSEVFVHTHRATLPPCWALCLGQALRVELGLIARAPAILRRCGLEWAWRLWQEPRRLAPRYALALAWFPVAVAADIAGGRPRD